ncbi:MAG: peptidylprolyl isomerase, partial [Pseudomonadota bacterium]
MRPVFLSALAFCMTAACQAQEAVQPEPSEEAVAAWRNVLPENLLLIETAHGPIAIEFNPSFAPNHVAQFRSLVRQK